MSYFEFLRGVVKDILNGCRFSGIMTNLFFLLSRHKFSSMALVTVVNFNAEKRKKTASKTRKAMCVEYNGRSYLTDLQRSKNSKGPLSFCETKTPGS